VQRSVWIAEYNICKKLKKHTHHPATRISLSSDVLVLFWTRISNIETFCESKYVLQHARKLLQAMNYILLILESSKHKVHTAVLADFFNFHQIYTMYIRIPNLILQKINIPLCVWTLQDSALTPAIPTHIFLVFLSGKSQMRKLPTVLVTTLLFNKFSNNHNIVHKYVYIYTHTHTHIYICVCVCVCVYLYIYLWTMEWSTELVGC
jgi:hypothetical protein